MRCKEREPQLIPTFQYQQKWNVAGGETPATTRFPASRPLRSLQTLSTLGSASQLAATYRARAKGLTFHGSHVYPACVGRLEAVTAWEVWMCSDPGYLCVSLRVPLKPCAISSLLCPYGHARHTGTQMNSHGTRSGQRQRKRDGGGGGGKRSQKEMITDTKRQTETRGIPKEAEEGE